MVKLKRNKLKTANIFSILTYWWLNDVFKHGQKNDLKVTDMLELMEPDTSKELCKQLESKWNLEMTDKTKNPSLFRVLLKTHRKRLILCGLGAFTEEILKMGIAIIASYLVKYFEEKDQYPPWHAYAYVASLTVAALSASIIDHQHFYYTHRVGWHMRASVCALMYKKMLRLSQKSLTKLSSGKIINLGATDVLRYDLFPPYMHYMWIGPLQTIIGITILWWEFGPAILAGASCFIVAMVVQVLCGKWHSKIRLIIAALTDKRVHSMNEVITGMRIVKMYAWEKPFARILSKQRRKEVSKILSSAFVLSCNMVIFTVQQKLVAMITILCFVLTGGTLSAFKVFYLIGILAALSISGGCFFLDSIEKTSQAMSSSKRIEGFLLSEEFCSNHINRKIQPKDAYVEMKDVSAEWKSAGDSHEPKQPVLDKVSLLINSGELFAVIGPVGAGKSSFLSAILGELPASSGEVIANGNIAYAGQTPWIFGGTVRDNILFGEEFDAVRYKEVLRTCCLNKDLDLLPNGDMTVVGERGVNLSGGQKARLNLARVAYKKDCNICVLDDPLSAVDPAVARDLYRNCISGQLMKDKIRILVTHQLQLLETADRILILNKGKVAGLGTYQELQDSNIDFTSLLKTKLEHTESENRSVRDCNFERSEPAIVSEISSISAIAFNKDPGDDRVMISTQPEEERQQGSVENSVYIEYLRVGSKASILFVFIILIVASHVLFLLDDWWLGSWSVLIGTYNEGVEKNVSFKPWNITTQTIKTLTATSGDMEAQFNSSYYLKVYIALCLSLVVVLTLRLLLNSYICVISGIRMHKMMFQAILQAPIRFFDTNPSGRILNRFSKDMGQVDELLPPAFQDFLYYVGHTLGVVILVAVINYLSLIIIIPAVVYFIWLRRYYINTSRDIKRLEGACRSPVFSLLSSTLQGLVDIRSFGVESNFIRDFHQAQDLHSASWFLFIVGSRWFGLRLELIGSAFVFVTAVASVLASSFLDIDAGLLGLILTQSTACVGLFQWGIRQSAEVESLMTSVERIQQYYKIPPEAPHEIPSMRPHVDWPFKGSIQFENVSFAYYAGGQNVLQNINFSVFPKEKIGLVGRTGAGKSSIVSALFRMAELSAGKILIDGIDISTIGLHDLRSNISIIPQDPILFMGPLRRNLDLFELYTDSEILEVLKQVQLHDFVMSLPSQLKTEMAEAGSNFSVGQRQLVCLARALLRKSKILLIDEATANVDQRTDSLIQDTIRENFSDCTVITIAHRINTIIDSDRIIVLKAGRIIEFDNPRTLLKNVNGNFREMVEAMGSEQARFITLLAEKAYSSRKKKG